MRLPSPLWLSALWIFICAYLSSVGWLLSAAHQLNATGYAAALLLGLLLLVLAVRKHPVPRVRYRWAKFKWRARHALPAIFYLLTGLAVLGGILYAPNNYDALTYRFPRILHWLAQGQWHWINTSENRLNLSAPGFEWLMVPLFVFTKTDRLFFLINALSQLMLPGLTFATLSRLGVSKRMAWIWMWVLPCGYCFVLQAGSIGNDTFAVVFLLGALAFFLLARQTQNLWPFWTGALSAGLLTGAKACNLPLLLPCMVAAIPSLYLVKKRPLVTLAVAAIAALCSFLPLAIFNTHYAGNWTGESKEGGMKLTHPGYGLLGNGLQFAVQNLAPPVFPFSKQWKATISKMQSHPPFPELIRHFPRLCLTVNELTQEESAGLGLGVTLLFLLTGTASACGVFAGKNSQELPKPSPLAPGTRRLARFIGLGGMVALLAYMAMLGSEAGSRLIAAYYPVLLILILLPNSNRALARRGSYRTICALAAATALPAVILTPSRPLWPAQTVTSILLRHNPGNALVQRTATVYAAYSRRSDSLGPLRAHLPADAKVIGFVGLDDSEVALWRPFGSRQVQWVCQTTPAASLPEVVVASDQAILENFGVSLDQWLRDRGAKVLATEKFTCKVALGPQSWYVIGCPAPEAGSAAGSAAQRPK